MFQNDTIFYLALEDICLSGPQTQWLERIHHVSTPHHVLFSLLSSIIFHFFITKLSEELQPGRILNKLAATAGSNEFTDNASVYWGKTKKKAMEWFTVISEEELRTYKDDNNVELTDTQTFQLLDGMSTLLDITNKLTLLSTQHSDDLFLKATTMLVPTAWEIQNPGYSSPVQLKIATLTENFDRLQRHLLEMLKNANNLLRNRVIDYEKLLKQQDREPITKTLLKTALSPKERMNQYNQSLQLLTAYLAQDWVTSENSDYEHKEAMESLDKEDGNRFGRAVTKCVHRAKGLQKRKKKDICRVIREANTMPLEEIDAHTKKTLDQCEDIWDEKHLFVNSQGKPQEPIAKANTKPTFKDRLCYHEAIILALRSAQLSNCCRFMLGNKESFTDGMRKMYHETPLFLAPNEDTQQAHTDQLNIQKLVRQLIYLVIWPCPACSVIKEPKTPPCSRECQSHKLVECLEENIRQNMKHFFNTESYQDFSMALTSTLFDQEFFIGPEHGFLIKFIKELQQFVLKPTIGVSDNHLDLLLYSLCLPLTENEIKRQEYTVEHKNLWNKCKKTHHCHIKINGQLFSRAFQNKAVTSHIISLLARTTQTGPEFLRKLEEFQKKVVERHEMHSVSKHVRTSTKKSKPAPLDEPLPQQICRRWHSEPIHETIDDTIPAVTFQPKARSASEISSERKTSQVITADEPFSPEITRGRTSESNIDYEIVDETKKAKTKSAPSISTKRKATIVQPRANKKSEISIDIEMEEIKHDVIIETHTDATVAETQPCSSSASENERSPLLTTPDNDDSNNTSTGTSDNRKTSEESLKESTLELLVGTGEIDIFGQLETEVLTRFNNDQAFRDSVCESAIKIFHPFAKQSNCLNSALSKLKKIGGKAIHIAESQPGALLAIIVTSGISISVSGVFYNHLQEILNYLTPTRDFTSFIENAGIPTNQTLYIPANNDSFQAIPQSEALYGSVKSSRDYVNNLLYYKSEGPNGVHYVRRSPGATDTGGFFLFNVATTTVLSLFNAYSIYQSMKPIRKRRSMLDMSEYAPAMYDGGMPTDYIIKFCDHHKGLSNKKVGLGYKCRDACENPCQGTKCGEDLCTNCLWFSLTNCLSCQCCVQMSKTCCPTPLHNYKETKKQLRQAALSSGAAVASKNGLFDMLKLILNTRIKDTLTQMLTTGTLLVDYFFSATQKCALVNDLLTAAKHHQINTAFQNLDDRLQHPDTPIELTKADHRIYADFLNPAFLTSACLRSDQTHDEPSSSLEILGHTLQGVSLASGIAGIVVLSALPTAEVLYPGLLTTLLGREVTDAAKEAAIEMLDYINPNAYPQRLLSATFGYNVSEDMAYLFQLSKQANDFLAIGGYKLLSFKVLCIGISKGSQSAAQIAQTIGKLRKMGFKQSHLITFLIASAIGAKDVVTGNLARLAHQLGNDLLRTIFDLLDQLDTPLTNLLEAHARELDNLTLPHGLVELFQKATEQASSQSREAGSIQPSSDSAPERREWIATFMQLNKDGAELLFKPVHEYKNNRQNEFLNEGKRPTVTKQPTKIKGLCSKLSMEYQEMVKYIHETDFPTSPEDEVLTTQILEQARAAVKSKLMTDEERIFTLQAIAFYLQGSTVNDVLFKRLMQGQIFNQMLGVGVKP